MDHLGPRLLRVVRGALRELLGAFQETFSAFHWLHAQVWHVQRARFRRRRSRASLGEALVPFDSSSMSGKKKLFVLLISCHNI